MHEPSEVPLLEVRDLVKVFPLPGSTKVIHACQDVSLIVRRGETLGVVGESGSGKTTLGRCVLRLLEPTSGEIVFAGEDLGKMPAARLRHLRAQMRIVFQEPLETLNPSLTIGRQVAEPLRIHLHMNRAERAARVRELLTLVGLPADVAEAYPGALSAGAAQRCSIARAIATDPKLVVLDEPTSALAPEAEAELISLLGHLQDKFGIAYIFISHNLSLVGEICDRIAVMYLSQVVETGTVKQVFENPQHPYTRALLAATLRPDPSQRREVGVRWERLEGEIPSPIDLPVGCYLAGRCLYAKERCHHEPQLLQPAALDGRPVRCWRAGEGIPDEDFAIARQAALARIEARVGDLIAVEERPL
jgi:oligopeptide/dipeptide ABC transporter ATP-binding protein